jgi:hypothetical protein
VILWQQARKLTPTAEEQEKKRHLITHVTMENRLIMYSYSTGRWSTGDKEQ